MTTYTHDNIHIAKMGNDQMSEITAKGVCGIMLKNLYEPDLKSMIHIATPFSSRTHDFVDSSIFSKPSRLDLSHGSNLLAPPLRLQETIAKASVWDSAMFQYDSPFGPSSLRELVAEYESLIYGDKINMDNILITLGGADGLALYFQRRAREIAQQSKPTALLMGPQYPTIARIAEAAGFTVAMTRHHDINSQLPIAAV
jgi:DNA-binding transcriptional MocR family regulator